MCAYVLESISVSRSGRDTTLSSLPSKWRAIVITCKRRRWKCKFKEFKLGHHFRATIGLVGLIITLIRTSDYVDCISVDSGAEWLVLSKNTSLTASVKCPIYARKRVVEICFRISLCPTEYTETLPHQATKSTSILSPCMHQGYSGISGIGHHLKADRPGRASRQISKPVYLPC